MWFKITFNWDLAPIFPLYAQVKIAHHNSSPCLSSQSPLFFLKTNCQLIFIVGIRGDLPSLWSFTRHSTVPPAEAQGCLECRYVCRTFRRSTITVCRNVTLLCQTVRAKMAPKLWDVFSCGEKRTLSPSWKYSSHRMKFIIELQM